MPPSAITTECYSRDFEPHRARVASVYAAAYAGPPYDETEEGVARFAEDWPARCREPGFRPALVTADEETVAMAYGWAVAPGSPWHAKMTRQLGPLAAEWLSDCFSLVDIAVKPECQGLGLGKQVHAALYGMVPNARSVLYTHQSDTAASKMYERLGWRTLARDLQLRSDKRFVLMGKHLA